jgi:hypothetical protein
VLRDSASSDDLPYPGEAAPRPEVRAEFLRWLATDPEAAPHIDPKGLRVYTATIPGKLDLEESKITRSLEFRRCTFQGEINLESAETRGIYILDSSLARGIDADGVIVHGSVFLRGTQSGGEIRLPRAEIAGNLECAGAKLNARGDALVVDRAKIGGSVFLHQAFQCEGEARLIGSEIGGDLDCSGAKLNAKADALSAHRAQIGGKVFLNRGFESAGEFCLPGATIGGDLVIAGAKVARVSC